MPGISYLRLVSAVFLLICNSAQAAGGGHIFGKSPVIFPQLFNGLTWEYDEKALRKNLPRSSVEDVESSDGNIDSIYKGIALPYFGESLVEVLHDKNGKIRFFAISTDEPRAELCSSTRSSDRPRDCRTRYGPQLTKIRDRLLAYIEPLYGKGVASRSCSWDYELKRKICENSYEWPVNDAARMFLEIYQGEDGLWAVELRIRSGASDRN